MLWMRRSGAWFGACMYTLALILRYGFVVALIIEAILIARAFLGLMREKAKTPPSSAEE